VALARMVGVAVAAAVVCNMPVCGQSS